MGTPCVVNRSFYVGAGVRLEVGTKVDSAEFPLAKQLINQRWLLPIVDLTRCAVTRPFFHGDRELKFGDVVDATGWPNAAQMIDQLFLKPMPGSTVDVVRLEALAQSWPAPVVEAVKRGRGRPRKIQTGG